MVIEELMKYFIKDGGFLGYKEKLKNIWMFLIKKDIYKLYRTLQEKDNLKGIICWLIIIDNGFIGLERIIFIYSVTKTLFNGRYVLFRETNYKMEIENCTNNSDVMNNQNFYLFYRRQFEKPLQFSWKLIFE